MDEKALRIKVEEAVVEYYRATHGVKKEFVAGKTYINYAGRVFDETELTTLVDSALDFWLTAGRFANQFETEFAKFLGLKYCMLTNSGSSANLLAVSALTSPKLKERRLVPGDEVLTVAAAFPTTVNPIVQNRLVPVFVDVELGTYNIKVDEIESAISDKTKVIFMAHTLGNPFDVDAVVRIAKEHNLWLLEDNCIHGDRCIVVRINGNICVMSITELYECFKSDNYELFEILSHGETFKEKICCNIGDLKQYNISEEFTNNLSKKQLDVIKCCNIFHGNVNKITKNLGISKAAYYCRLWAIRKKARTFNGIKYRWSRINNIVRKGSADVVTITQNFGQTSITKDHLLKVFDNDNQLIDKSAVDFIKDRGVFTNILLTDNAKISEIDLVDYFKDFSQDNGKIQYDTEWIWFEYTKNCWKGKMLEMPKIKRKYSGSDLKKLCALFGFYSSEGSCGHELRFGSTNKTYIQMMIAYIKSISNLKSVRLSISNPKIGCKIRGCVVNSTKPLYSANLGHEIFNILFSILGGTDSYNKRVPNFIFNLHPDYMKVYYDNYVKGDGCRKSGDNIDFVITTSSMKLAAGVNLLNNLIFKRHSRFIIAKNKYYDVSPVKSICYIKKRINDVKEIKNVPIFDIVVEGTSSFVDACGNILLHNCDALGSKFNGQYTGTFGDMATHSFFPAHSMTMGEGGAVVTNSLVLKQIVESFRDWGRDCNCSPGSDNSCGKRFNQTFGRLPAGYDHKYVYSHLGYNLKLTEMQAAIGVAQLKKLPEFIETRKQNFNKLFSAIRKYNQFVITPKVLFGAEPSWFGFPMTVMKDAPFSRNDIVSYLEACKIATRPLFAGNILNHPSFDDVAYRVHKSLDNNNIVLTDTFWIGVYPGLTDEMLSYVISSFDSFMARFI